MKYLKAIGYIILYVVAMILAQTIVVNIFKAMKAANMLSQGTLEFLKTNGTVISAISCWLALFFILLVFKPLKKQSMGSFIKFKPLTGKTTLFVSLIAISMGFFSTSFIGYSFITKNVPALDSTVKHFMATGDIIAIILSSVLLVPTFEELFFRGLVFSEIKGLMPLWLAVIVQGLFYAVFQPNIAAAAFGLAGGMIFALVYVWSDSIWSSVLLQTLSCFCMFLFRAINLNVAIAGLGDVVITLIIAAAVAVMAYSIIYLGKHENKAAKSIKA